MAGVRSIAVIAALPREIAGLVKGLKPDAELRRRGVWLYRMDRAVVVAAGMGAARAAVAVEAALKAADIGVLISVGLAGGCGTGVSAGDVVEAQVVVDVRTGERFVSAKEEVGQMTLATTSTIASVKEKRRLLATYGALMVDMEGATVARLARAHGVGFRAIKGISDGPEFELEALGRFEGKQGSFRTGAFALHTALRPWEWGRAIELGRGSGTALKGLETVLRGIIFAA